MTPAKNRSCPKCHTKQTKDWLDARKTEMLPTDYFHVTITVPQTRGPFDQPHRPARPRAANTLHILLTRLLVDSLAKPDAWPASILIDELDAARIQCRADLSYCFASAAQFPIRGLEPSDCWF
jgi:Transposase zinc-binding domain